MTKVSTGVRRVTQNDLQELKKNIQALCKSFVNAAMKQKQEVSNLDKNSNLSLTEFINDFMDLLEKYNKEKKITFKKNWKNYPKILMLIVYLSERYISYIRTMNLQSM